MYEVGITAFADISVLYKLHWATDISLNIKSGHLKHDSTACVFQNNDYTWNQPFQKGHI